MLYEVITHLACRLHTPRVSPGSTGSAITASGTMPLAAGGKGMLSPTSRITSYNVCYTKLLRAVKVLVSLEHSAVYQKIKSICFYPVTGAGNYLRRTVTCNMHKISFLQLLFSVFPSAYRAKRTASAECIGSLVGQGHPPNCVAW